MRAELAGGASWLRWRLFPWNLSRRTRRIIGGLGGGLLVLDAWALGVVMASRAMTARLWLGFLVESGFALLLIFQMPRSICASCHAAEATR